MNFRQSDVSWKFLKTKEAAYVRTSCVCSLMNFQSFPFLEIYALSKHQKLFMFSVSKDNRSDEIKEWGLFSLLLSISRFEASTQICVFNDRYLLCRSFFENMIFLLFRILNRMLSRINEFNVCSPHNKSLLMIIDLFVCVSVGLNL